MRIGILSRGPYLYSTQSLYRAGLRKGHQVRIIDHTRCDFVLQQGQPAVFFEGESLEGFDAVIPRIGSSVTSIGAALISQLELMDVFCATRSNALLQSRDKLRCLHRLAAQGLEVPDTAYVSSSEDVERLSSLLGGFPVVIKLLESTHGVGVLKAETLQQAMATVEAFQRLKERVIMQEFIHEAGGADIRAFVVAGRIVAAMKRQAREGEFRSNLHRGATAEKEVLTGEEKKAVLKATQALGLDIAGVDFLRSNRGPLILEVNASPGLEGIEGVTGINVAGHIIEFVERRVRSLQRRKNSFEQ